MLDSKDFEPVCSPVARSPVARRAEKRRTMRKADRPWVLLGEDDEDLRDLLCHLLEARGYVVSTAKDGEELSSMVGDALTNRQNARHPDLLISDVRMPKQNGISVLKTLRRAGWDLPVIIITAFPDRELQRTVRSLDATLFEKPFSATKLLHRVQEILARAE